MEDSAVKPLIPIRGSTSKGADDGLYVDGVVEGMAVRFLVDTGASVTMLKTSVYETLPEAKRIPLEGEDRCMLLADGSTLPFTGRGKFTIGVGPSSAVHEVLIANIDVDGILGMDFLRAQKCELRLENKGYVLVLPEGQVSCRATQGNLACRRVAICETVVIPPRSEVIVAAEFVEGEATDGAGVLEATTHFQKRNNLLVARALVHTNQHNVPLRLLNPSDSAQTVFKRSIAAVCEPVESVDQGESDPARVNCVRPPGKEDNLTGAGNLPLHLVDLYERSVGQLNSEQQEAVKSLLIEFSDVFSAGPGDIGRTSLVTHQISTGDARPIRQQARRLPLHKKLEAEKEINNMLERDIIEPSCSPWALPIVLARKADGSTRFCIDYRKLNAVTIKDPYPLPRIDDTLDALVGSQWFSTLDLSSRYWQVEVSEEDKPKTAFSTGTGGLCQFKVMPFGLCNAPATFERLMEQVLSGLPWEILLIYLDDVIVYAKTWEEELERLRRVFTRLSEAKLKLNPKKCHLFKSRVKYLGHVVSQEGVSTDPDKIAAIKDWPVPSNTKDLRSFLGLCSYYRRYVKGFAEVAKPLYRLQERETDYVWTGECDRSFQLLKGHLTASPILAFPNADESFILDTDASNTGVGAVLSQQTDGCERVVAYYSRTLTKAERNYCVTRRELLAVILAIRNFRHYLLGKSFRVRTDHGALQWLMGFRNPDGQMARWLEELSMYEFVIEYRRGGSHGNADGLSRRPCCECSKCAREEEKEARRMKEAGETVACNVVKKPTWVQQWSSEDIRKEQRADEGVAKMVMWKEKSTTRPTWTEVAREGPDAKSYWAQWDRMVLKDGVLYRQWETEAGDSVSLQLVLPQSYREEVLTQLHNSPTSGHLGIKKTIARVKERFYWNGYTQDVRRWCQHCDTCASRSGPPKKPKAGMRTYNVGTPLERIAVDITGPFTPSDQGNKYVLVVGDYFTKWTEAYALPDQEVKTVARVLAEEFIPRYGVPREIHSDQDRNFESALFKEIAKILGMEKTRTTPLRPQSDGMVERFNRTLKNMLAKFVNENLSDWDRHLPLLMMAYRSAVHETTGCSPSELMFGREVRLPVDLLFSPPDVDKEGEGVSDYAQALQERIKRVHRYAREHLNIESERQRQKYDQQLNQRTYDRGDAVWFYNPKRKKKISPCLQRPWEGPYVVLKRISDVVYRIQKTPQSKPRVIHHDRLRPYEGEAVPTWLPPQRGRLNEASVGGTGFPPPPGISDSKSGDSKKQNMVTSGTPSAKGGPPLLDQDPRPNHEPYNARDNKCSGPSTLGRPTRSRRAPSWARDYYVDV